MHVSSIELISLFSFLSCLPTSSIHIVSLKMESECQCEGGNKDFPAGSVMRKFENAIFPIAGSLYRMEKILWERYNTDYHQRRAVFEAEECKTKDPVVVKFFLECVICSLPYASLLANFVDIGQTHS